MQGECYSMIDQNKTQDIYLSHINLSRMGDKYAYPGKLHVHRSLWESDVVIYVPREECYIDITMDDDYAIGHAECSNCKNPVGVYVKFCPYCGAKVKGKNTKEAVKRTLFIFETEETDGKKEETNEKK